MPQAAPSLAAGHDLVTRANGALAAAEALLSDAAAKVRERVTVESWAKESGLSPKYSRLLWDAVEGKSEDQFFLRWLRSRWTALPAAKDRARPNADEVRSAARALAADVQALSLDLCPQETPAIVAHAGNGPIEHLARRLMHRAEVMLVDRIDHQDAR